MGRSVLKRWAGSVNSEKIQVATVGEKNKQKHGPTNRPIVQRAKDDVMRFGICDGLTDGQMFKFTRDSKRLNKEGRGKKEM